MTKESVKYQRNGSVGMITLNRPERLNAISGDLIRDFVKQLNVAREDKKAVSVILTGMGTSFCAGEDLKETSAGKTFDTWIAEANGLQDIQRLILRLDKPLIAAVQGYALGGGCEFAMSSALKSQRPANLNAEAWARWQVRHMTLEVLSGPLVSVGES